METGGGGSGPPPELAHARAQFLELVAKGKGTAAEPWQLKTPPGTSDYDAYLDPAAEPPALMVQVGKTQLRYHLRMRARTS